MSDPNLEDEFDDDLPQRPSKSQIKRDMHALLDLGKQLIELSTDQLKRLPLSEKLYDAVVLAQRTNAREGRRRQVHYVGKLMRDADAETIRQQLDTWANGSREQTAHMHRLEAIRDRLLVDDEALTKLLNDYPATDITRLRTLIREARKEARANDNLLQGQSPQRKHYRALFQALKTLMDEPESA